MPQHPRGSGVRAAVCHLARAPRAPRPRKRPSLAQPPLELVYWVWLRRPRQAVLVARALGLCCARPAWYRTMRSAGSTPSQGKQPRCRLCRLTRCRLPGCNPCRRRTLPRCQRTCDRSHGRLCRLPRRRTFPRRRRCRLAPLPRLGSLPNLGPRLRHWRWSRRWAAPPAAHLPASTLVAKHRGQRLQSRGQAA